MRRAGTPVEVWHQDEARVGQQGTLSRVWAEKGSRPRAPKDLRYGWAYLFGAVCADRGVGAALVLPEVNAEAMGLHLAEISRHVAPGAHAVVVLDGAGWHQTGGRLAVEREEGAHCSPDPSWGWMTGQAEEAGQPTYALLTPHGDG